MRYLVRLNDLDEKITFFQKKVEEIDELIKNLETIKTTLSWEGNSANVFFSQYDTHILNLKKLERYLISCTDFFKAFSSSYGEEYDKIRREFLSKFNEEELKWE